MRNKILSRVKSGFLAKFLPATLILAAAPAMVAQSSPIVFTGLETYNWGTGGPGYGSAIGLATDSAGNVYVSEPGQTRIRKVTPDGTRSVYLQTGSKQPKGMVVDLTNNLWYVDSQPVSGNQGTTITMHPLDGSAEVSIWRIQRSRQHHGGFGKQSIRRQSRRQPCPESDSRCRQPLHYWPHSSGASSRHRHRQQQQHVHRRRIAANKVYHYDATTGAFINTLVPAASCQVRDLAVNGAGDLFVGCQTTSLDNLSCPL